MTECVIQSEFYHQCRNIGLNVSLEFKTPVGRLDVAVFNEDWTQLVAIVEVKDGQVLPSRQIERYKTLGVPVYGLNDFNRCYRLAMKIRDQHKTGVLLSSVHKARKINRRGFYNKEREAKRSFNRFHKYDLSVDLK